MKKLLTFIKIGLSLLIVAMVIIGCTTVKTVTTTPDGSTVTNTTHVFDLATATNAINGVVPAAVKVLVAKEPKAGPYLRDVSVLINGFILGGNLSPDNLRAALASAGMKELRTDEALAITETVLALYQTYFGQAVRDNVGENVNVIPILKALANSIDAGLAQPSASIQLPIFKQDGLYWIDFVGRNPKPCPYGGWIVENDAVLTQ